MDLINGRQEKGTHMMSFDLGQLQTGIYSYRLDAGKLSETKKLIVIK